VGPRITPIPKNPRIGDKLILLNNGTIVMIMLKIINASCPRASTISVFLRTVSFLREDKVKDANPVVRWFDEIAGTYERV